MNTKLLSKIALVGLLTGLTLSGVFAAERQLNAFFPPKAWIDFPRDQMRMEPGSLEVVAHSAASAGVKATEISVNGAVVQTLVNPASDKKMVTVRLPYDALTEGVYLFELRTQDQNDRWSEKATAQLTVAVPVVVQVVPETPVVEPVLPIEVEEEPEVIQPMAVDPGPVLSDPVLSTDHFYYRGDGCGPLELTLTVVADDPKGVQAVTVYYRLLEKTSSTSPEWVPLTLTKALSRSSTHTTWSATIAGDEIPGFAQHSDAWWQFYLTGTNAAGTVSTSTQFMDKVTLSVCSQMKATQPEVIRNPNLIKLPITNTQPVIK
jgi:hypothetical protein